MASIYDIKPAFQNLLRPVSNHLAARGTTPNQVTIAALLLSGLGGASITLYPDASWPLLCLPVILLLRMVLNAIDGMLAREHDMKSSLGVILNELGDVVSDTVLYLPFALLPAVSGTAVVMVVVLAIISEMTGVVAVQAGASRRYDGPMGKSDRALVFAVLALALGFGFSAGIWIDGVLIVVAVLTAVTIVNRCRQSLAEGSTP